MNYYFIGVYSVNFLFFRQKSIKKMCRCSMKEISNRLNYFFNPIHISIYNIFLESLKINKSYHYLAITQLYISLFFLFLYFNNVYTCKNCNKNIYFNNYIEETKIDKEKLCHICLEGFDSKNKPFCLTFCNNKKHPFHKDCIEEMFKYSKICPVCKN